MNNKSPEPRREKSPSGVVRESPSGRLHSDHVNDDVISPISLPPISRRPQSRGPLSLGAEDDLALARRLQLEEETEWVARRNIESEDLALAMLLQEQDNFSQGNCPEHNPRSRVVPLPSIYRTLVQDDRLFDAEEQFERASRHHRSHGYRPRAMAPRNGSEKESKRPAQERPRRPPSGSERGPISIEEPLTEGDSVAQAQRAAEIARSSRLMEAHRASSAPVVPSTKIRFVRISQPQAVLLQVHSCICLSYIFFILSMQVGHVVVENKAGQNVAFNKTASANSSLDGTSPQNAITGSAEPKNHPHHWHARDATPNNW